MRRALISGIGIRVIAAAMIMLSLSGVSLTHANDAPTDTRYVQVAYDGLARYLLDTAVVKRHTGLSGQSLIDVWVEGRFDAGAGNRVQTLLGGYPPGIDYSQAGKVRARYLFRLDDSILQLEAKAAVIERQYFDRDGRLIHRKSFAPPATAAEWRSLNETEKKVLQALMLEPTFQAAKGFDKELLRSAAVKALDEGFLGRPWGTRPTDFKDARHIADIAPKVSVYSADIDLSPILGLVNACSAPRLVFTEDGGLAKARVAFDPRDYDRIQQHLVGVLGEPSPILYEFWAGRIDFAERSEWFVGVNTKVVLTSWLSVAALEIGRRGSLSLEGRRFEERLAAAQMKQDQERLAIYSGRNDAVEFLGRYRGYAFSRLLNTFPDVENQHWLRIDLENEARVELLKHRPADIGLQLADIAAVLCRVRVVPAAARYTVVEQVWLDSANRIIGGSPAGTPQDVWPTPYIRQACEEFLAGWFTVGGRSEPGPKKADE